MVSRRRGRGRGVGGLPGCLVRRLEGAEDAGCGVSGGSMRGAALERKAR